MSKSVTLAGIAKKHFAAAGSPKDYAGLRAIAVSLNKACQDPRFVEGIRDVPAVNANGNKCTTIGRKGTVLTGHGISELVGAPACDTAQEASVAVFGG